MNNLNGNFQDGPRKPVSGNSNISFFEEDTISIWLYGRIYPGKEPAGFSREKNMAKIFYSLYNELQDDMLIDLDGDFTVIIKDNNQWKIFRDFKGAGPQIFYNDTGFADHPDYFFTREKTGSNPDLKSLSFFLKYGYIPPHQSGFQGIKRIPPGFLMIREKEIIRLQNLNNKLQKQKVSLPGNEKEIGVKFGELHREAIKKRIENQNKIALLLSGGYDSGGNLASLRDIYKGEVDAYTISFKDNPFSELEFVKIMSDHFGVDLKNYIIDGSEIKDLPLILKQTGIPFQESGLMINYSVMKMAGKDKPGVILGGDGNDQFFGTGGTEVALKHFTRKTGLIFFLRCFKALTRNQKKTIFQKINFYTDKIDHILKADRWGFENRDLKITPDEKEVFNTSARGPLKKLLAERRKKIDIPQTIGQVILFKASRMAEIFNLPLTFPYLTPELYALINSLPADLRIRGSYKDLLKGRGKGKYLHKLYFNPKLPESITSRKKQGGFVPLSVFFSEETRNKEYLTLIEQSGILEQLLKNKKHTISEMKAFLKKENPWFWEQQFKYSQLLNLLVLAVWEKLYIEGEDLQEI